MDDIHSDQDMIVAPGNVPAFLFKLWIILENPVYETLISWNQVKNFILHQNKGKTLVAMIEFHSGI